MSNSYFSAFPYQTGSVLLKPIPNIAVAFCKYVHLNNKRFESDFPMHIQLTIAWRNQTFKEGAAVWSENVTTFGFNACVIVAGRHFLGQYQPRLCFGSLIRKLYLFHQRVNSLEVQLIYPLGFQEVNVNVYLVFTILR